VKWSTIGFSGEISGLPRQFNNFSAEKNTGKGMNRRGIEKGQSKHRDG
jgi:hypothetical protein